ncbi:MAG: YceI family protein [Novosphingobium sp.]
MNKLALAAALGVAATIALPLTAQPMQKPGSANPALVKAGTYQADPGHTLVEWSVDHMGYTPYFGLFGDIAGSLVIDPKDPAAAKVDVTIPVAKITTVNAALTAHLLKPAAAGGKAEFFGANPAAAHFVSTKVEPLDGNRARITGDLTLNGVTKPVTLDAAFYGAGNTGPMMGNKEGLGFTATGTLRRSDFDLSYGVPIVSDEVALKISAAFLK